MPFLTCSCWGHSAHTVKVDEIFKVTEIYKVTLAGHPASFFFLASVQEQLRARLHCLLTVKGECCIKNCSRTKTEPKIRSAPGKMIEGEGEERQEQLSIASFQAQWCSVDGSIHPFPPASEEGEAFVKMLLPCPAAACLLMWVAPALA